MSQKTDLDLPMGCAVQGAVRPGYESILTREALEFVAELARKFGPRVKDLLARREARQKEIDAGRRPDFLPETRAIREHEWHVTSIPADLQDRRVEITGPTDRKMIINALNSGAKVFMADCEDSMTPTWDNVVQGQLNLRDAVARRIDFTSPEGKQYKLNPTIATLIVRPRGWHLYEKHVFVDGQQVPGAFVDFGLYIFHNHAELKRRGTGPYFYLPKTESHLESRLWAEVFRHAEARLGIAPQTIKVTVLIETILAAFEMDEILWELRDYIVGLNCGRWDYIFSFIKKFSRYPEFVLPDRGQVTMTTGGAGQQDQRPDTQQLESGGHAVHLRQQAEHHQPQSQVVGLGQRMQPRERIGKAQQPSGAGEKKDGAGGDRDHRPQVENEAHLSSSCTESSSVGADCALTKAKLANAASNASVKATSIVAASPVAVPARSRLAMPPVPSSWAAIMRSASPGPRRMRTSPSATIASKKIAAASRKSVMAPPCDECPGEQFLLLPQFFDHWLRGVEAVIDQRVVGCIGRHRARQEAGDGGESVARQTGRKIERAIDEARTQRQARVERTAGDIDPGQHRFPDEVRQQREQAAETQIPGRGCEQVQAEPGCAESGEGADREIGRLGALHQHHPEREERHAARQRRAPRRLQAGLRWDGGGQAHAETVVPVPGTRTPIALRRSWSWASARIGRQS